MSGASYFQLLTPLIFLVFAIGYLLVWRQDRTIRSARLAAISYGCGAFAFLADFSREIFSVTAAIYVTNIPYLLVVVLLVAALQTHMTGTVRWALIGGLMAAVLVGISWFRFVSDDIVVRTLIVNFGASLIMLGGVLPLRAHVRGRVQQWAYGVAVAIGVVLALRVAVVLWFTAGTLSNETYVNSVASLTLHFAAALCSLAMAMVLFTMYGKEIITTLAKRADADDLTGLANRRVFNSAMEDHVRSALQRGMDFCLILIDIDRFKLVNDTHGHAAGDRVLVAVAEILRGCAGSEAVLARLGGEEFAVVTRLRDERVAQLLAENIRTSIAAGAGAKADVTMVTASLGVCQWGPGLHPALMRELADDALYEAKRSGRDRVVMSSRAVVASSPRVAQRAEG